MPSQLTDGQNRPRKLTAKAYPLLREATILILVALATGVGAWLYFGAGADQETEQDPDPNGISLAGEMTFLPNSVTEFTVYQNDIARSCPAFGIVRRYGEDPDRLAFAEGPGPSVRSVVVSKPFPMTILTMRNVVSPKAFFGPKAWAQVTPWREGGKTVYFDGRRCYWFVGRRVAAASLRDF